MEALRNHDLENGLLPEGVGDDLEPSALLEEQPLKKIGAGRAAMGKRQAQVGVPGLNLYQG